MPFLESTISPPYFERHRCLTGYVRLRRGFSLCYRWENLLRMRRHELRGKSSSRIVLIDLTIDIRININTNRQLLIVSRWLKVARVKASYKVGCAKSVTEKKRVYTRSKKHSWKKFRFILIELRRVRAHYTRRSLWVRNYTVAVSKGSTFQLQFRADK